MNFLETSPPLDLNDLKQIEDKLAIQFPEDFKSHYLLHNGGYPSNDNYRWRTGGITGINIFFSFKSVGHQQVEEIYENLVITEKYLPVGIIPFASDNGGNFFCVSAREQDYGQVFYCNNDHYVNGNPESPLVFLENSLNDFLDKLF
jgi:cell wall assembly regulator SMI1